jgi:hypothetical protein
MEWFPLRLPGILEALEALALISLLIGLAAQGTIDSLLDRLLEPPRSRTVIRFEGGEFARWRFWIWKRPTSSKR